MNVLMRLLVLVPSTALLAACGFFPFNPSSREGAAVLERAPKPPPVDSAFHDCGPEGSQPDYPLNALKNRVDTAARYVSVPWGVIARLPWPRTVGYRFRKQWTEGERREVKRYEGAPVQIEGYIADYEMKGPEPPNCYRRDEQDRDYHVWLGEDPHAAKRNTVITELTPRVRAFHPAWNDSTLAQLEEGQVRVRISGWLTLDQMHPESIGGVRITLWEIHPVMRIEWQRPDSVWVPLDSAGPA